MKGNQTPCTAPTCRAYERIACLPEGLRGTRSISESLSISPSWWSVSPDQYRPEMAAKAKIYLGAGVRLVWIVWPASQRVDVWRPGCESPVATLGAGDARDGLHVVPGFTYSLADLFA